MSNWGKGALNNTIGWGQGFINSISWGAIYNLSYSGNVRINGLSSNIESIISNFKTRVAADSGAFEAEANLRAILTTLSTTE